MNRELELETRIEILELDVEELKMLIAEQEEELERLREESTEWIGELVNGG